MLFAKQQLGIASSDILCFVFKKGSHLLQLFWRTRQRVFLCSSKNVLYKISLSFPSEWMWVDNDPELFTQGIYLEKLII